MMHANVIGDWIRCPRTGKQHLIWVFSFRHRPPHVISDSELRVWLNTESGMEIVGRQILQCHVDAYVNAKFGPTVPARTEQEAQ